MSGLANVEFYARLCAEVDAEIARVGAINIKGESHAARMARRFCIRRLHTLKQDINSNRATIDNWEAMLAMTGKAPLECLTERGRA